MKKLIILGFVMILLAIVLYGEVPEDEYHYNGSRYMRWLTNSSDMSINQVVAVNGTRVDTQELVTRWDNTNWDYYYFTDRQAHTGTLSVACTLAGKQCDIEHRFNNNSFTSTIEFYHYVDGNITSGSLVIATTTGGPELFRAGLRSAYGAPNNHFFRNSSTVAPCDENVIPEINNTWMKWTFDFSNGYPEFFVDDVLCHNFSNQANDLNLFAMSDEFGNDLIDYWDDFEVYNIQPSPPPPPAEQVNITFPLGNISTKNLTINISYAFNFNATNCSLYTNQTGNFTQEDSIQAGEVEIFNITEINQSEFLTNLYRMEEGTGINFSDSTGQRHGEIFQANFSPSKSGNGTGNYSLQFDGNDYALIPDNPDIETILNATVSLWAFVNESGTNIHLLAKHNTTTFTGFVLFRHTSNDLRFQAGNGSQWNTINLASSTSLLTGNWYHIALTINISHMSMYIDGQLDAQGASDVIAQNDQPLWVGGDTITGTWKGKIDEIAIFNTSFSADEILDIYNNGVPLSSNTSQSTTINQTLNQSVNNSFFWEFIPDSVITADYYITCYDSVNINSTFQRIEYVSDFTAPVITVLYPPLDTAVNDNSVWINFTVSEFADCQVNNTGWNQIIGNGTFYAFSDTGVPSDDYNIRILCEDNAVNFGSVVWNFTKDIIEPAITWVFPNEVNTSTQFFNLSKKLDIVANDENLYAYECLVYEPLGSLAYNFSGSNLAVTSFTVDNETIFTEFGNVTVQCSFSDSHTKAKIDEYSHMIIDNKIDFDFSKIEDKKKIKHNISITYMNDANLVKSTTEKLSDRYIFRYKLDKNYIKNFETLQHKIRVECPDIRLVDSDYIAHFICPAQDNTLNGYWVDFESPDVITYYVEEVEGNISAYDVYLEMKSQEIISFSSIGGLNVNTETKQFEIIQAPVDFFETLSFGNCPTDSIAEVLIFIFLFLLIVLFYFILKTWIRVPILSVAFLLVGGLSFAFALVGCSKIVGGLFAVLTIILMVFEMWGNG